MKHHIMRCRGIPVLGLDGEFTSPTSPETRQMLFTCLKRDPTLVVLLADVTRIDSAGLATLVEALQASRRQGGNLLLAALSPELLHVLQLSNLDKVFPLFPSLDDALSSLKEGS